MMPTNLYVYLLVPSKPLKERTVYPYNSGNYIFLFNSGNHTSQFSTLNSQL
jgi:hypothetical protein